MNEKSYLIHILVHLLVQSIFHSDTVVTFCLNTSVFAWLHLLFSGDNMQQLALMQAMGPMGLMMGNM